MPAPETSYRLLYASKAQLTGTDVEQAETVRCMGEHAERRNRSCGLTGRLVHVDDSFGQVLERPVHAIETVFERICCDFRHDSLRIIDLAPAAGRMFDDWSMATLSEAGSDDLMRAELQEARFLVGVNTGEALRQMRALLSVGDIPVGDMVPAAG